MSKHVLKVFKQLQEGLNGVAQVSMMNTYRIQIDTLSQHVNVQVEMRSIAANLWQLSVKSKEFSAHALYARIAEICEDHMLINDTGEIYHIPKDQKEMVHVLGLETSYFKEYNDTSHYPHFVHFAGDSYFRSDGLHISILDDIEWEMSESVKLQKIQWIGTKTRDKRIEEIKNLSDAKRIKERKERRYLNAKKFMEAFCDELTNQPISLGKGFRLIYRIGFMGEDGCDLLELNDATSLGNGRIIVARIPGNKHGCSQILHEGIRNIRTYCYQRKQRMRFVERLDYEETHS